MGLKHVAVHDAGDAQGLYRRRGRRDVDGAHRHARRDRQSAVFLASDKLSLITDTLTAVDGLHTGVMGRLLQR